MIKARFQRLLAVLDGLDPAKFNMNTWMHRGSCGTAGCMIGHYISSGAAKHLTMAPAIDGYVRDIRGPCGTSDFEAIAKEFGIGWEEASMLFGIRFCGAWSRGPAGLRLAKKRVRDFMRSHA